MAWTAMGWTAAIVSTGVLMAAAWLRQGNGTTVAGVEVPWQILLAIGTEIKPRLASGATEDAGGRQELPEKTVQPVVHPECPLEVDRNSAGQG
jgi:hypothetical protein